MIINLCERCLDTGKVYKRMKAPEDIKVDGKIIKKDEYFIMVHKCDWCDKGKEL